MKLTKKLEAEILELYYKYWDAYLNGKMKTMSSLMDKNCQLIGSGMGEVFKNKKDAVKYYTITADQVAGKAEMRNRNISLTAAGNNILVTEESDFYVFMDKSWAFYGQGRVSTLFSKSENKWKIIQQHGSLPDSRTGGGEQLNTDQIKEENLRLKDAVKRRTIELENKNRELEIEAALERIRARTMAMQKSDELREAVLVIYEQLKQLNFEAQACNIIIIDKDSGDMQFWVSGFTQEIYPESYHIPRLNHHYHEDQLTAWKKGVKYEVFEYAGKEKKSFDKMFFTKTDFKKVPEQAKQFMMGLKSVKLSTAFFSYGSLQVLGQEEISEEKIKILQRFAKVFEQTYRRFLDLHKAEAQAREAQIEASLERTRTQSMLMQHSEQLDDSLRVFHQQVLFLGIPSAFSFLWLPDENKDRHIFWAAWKENNSFKSKAIDYPLDRNEPATAQCLLDWKGNNPVVSYRVPPDGVESYFAVWQELFGSAEHLKPKYFPDGLYYVEAFIKHGCFGVVVEKEMAEKEKKLLNRFATEFERTYTRFLDLQKAEAQAREAQIELALERVRAKAMAMQSSDELSDLVDTVFKELTKLDFALSWCIINIIDESSLSNTVWAANPNIDMAPDSYHMKFEDYPFHDAMMKGYKERKTKYIYVLEGNEKKAYDEYLFKETEFRKVPEEAQAASRAMEKYVVSFSFSNFGGLQTVGEEPLSDDNLDILARFGKVFDLTYTRFNDLLKAEAQAREAQIEAALERVRSRSMGMQKSEELKEVIQLVYEQFVHLKINVDHAGFVVDYTPKGEWHFWIADKQQIPSEIIHPYFDSVWANQFDEAKENGRDFFATNLNFEEKNKFYQVLLNLIPGLPEEAKEFYFSCPGLAGSTVLLENVGLYIENFSAIPYSDEENKTLMRFGKVFQQTYTRFLDLQKAEAQAREAQIEAALERVRTNAMAMQTSDDFAKIVEIVFTELNRVGFQTSRCGIGIIESAETKKVDIWSTTLTDENLSIQISGDEVLEGHALLDGIIEHWINQTEFSYVLEGEDFLKYYTTIEKTNFHLPDSAQKKLSSDEKQYYYYAPCKAGGIYAFSIVPFTDEVKKLLRRFIEVFQLTYTRYVDLKKAEAQAREAQIEAALEKVRSRSLAMHKSEELQQVVTVAFERLKELNISMDAANINIFTEGSREADLWIAAPGQKYAAYFHLPYIDYLIPASVFDARENGHDFFTKTFSFEEKNKYFNYLFEHSDFKQLPDNRKNIMLEASAYTVSFAFTKNSAISMHNYSEKSFTDEENDILKRFAKVFDQAYIRFLDLQKAEAQARESQIEAALERVRSRTMAMQQSDELAETASEVFKQLITLGIEPNRIYIVIIKDENGLGEFWITDEDGSKVSSGFTASLNDNRTFQKMFIGWKEKKESITIDMQGEELQEYFRHLTKLNVPFKGGLSQKRRLQYIAYFSKGFIGVASPDETKPETIDLLERFGAVFNLTYTRFNDLLQAEAQNKIIQAENERKTKELEEARELQLAMLPKEIPVVPNLDIKVYMQTATEVGGDYYDFSFSNDGSINIVIGDATGHGMKAGTIVTMLKSLFIANSTSKNIEDFFITSNAAIKNSNLKRMMAGFAMLNIKDHIAKYINAAMPPVYHYKKNEAKVEEIKQHNLPLGAMKIEKYNATEINLNIGDVLIMMSDGFPELHNPTDELFGYERVYSAFEKAAEKEPVEIIRYLNEESARWIKDKELQDDVTFVVIKIK